MIRALHIARFRGIRELVADGFGRVNLIIGKNDCGKTALLEALQLADDPESAAQLLVAFQRGRLGRAAKIADFARFWRPIFFDLDAKTGVSLWCAQDEGARRSIEIKRSGAVEEIVFDRRDAQDVHEHEDALLDDEDGFKLPTWALDLQLALDGAPIRRRIVATSTRVKLPPASDRRGGAWIPSNVGVSELDVRNVSALKQRGQDGTLVELLREVDGRLSGIELLAPGGDVAELFVRLDNGTPMLPLSVMGEGFQRCLEYGAAAAAQDASSLFIDEIENGLHHLVLEPLWRWIAATARRRNLQVFATTHSDECIQAACRAFQGVDDDGLRVIRLDRLESETRATIYDRALVEAAERTGIEIRG